MTSQMIVDEPYGFIYVTENLLNGKKYIGQHTNFNDKYLGSGTVIKKAIGKYGNKNFKRKIIYIAYNESELNFAEKLFIRSRNAVKSNMYYNIAEGGLGGNSWAGKTNEEIEIIKYKISEGMKGNKNPVFGKTGINAPFFGKTYTHTNEAKQKIGIANKIAQQKKVLLVDIKGNIIEIFQSVDEVKKGNWRKQFPKPNGMDYVMNCLRNKLLFHNHYLIYEGDYNEFKSNAF
jgi:group I intron endonuclease